MKRGLDLTIKVIQLLLQQEARQGLGHVLGHTLSGGMGAVGSAEGIIHVQVSRGSQLQGEQQRRVRVRTAEQWPQHKNG